MGISRIDGKSARLALLTVLFPAFGGVAVAQTSPAPEAAGQSAADGTEPGIDTIIVSGTRRESDVQDVPVAIDVVGANEIQAAGINNPSDIE